jgi:hypothetical protein
MLVIVDKGLCVVTHCRQQNHDGGDEGAEFHGRPQTRSGYFIRILDGMRHNLPRGLSD